MEQDKTTNPQDPLEAAWNKFSKNEFDETIALAEKHTGHADVLIKNEAKKLIGLAKFRQLKFAESEKIFLELAQGSENSNDWFNVVTSAALNKNIPLSKTAFDTAADLYQTHQTKGNLSVAYMAFYYTLALRDIKEYVLAFEQFGLLRDIFSSVSITDSHFLYVRGIPSFETTLKEAKLIFENNPKASVTALLDHLTKKVDEPGAAFIEEFSKTLNFSN